MMNRQSKKIQKLSALAVLCLFLLQELAAAVPSAASFPVKSDLWTQINPVNASVDEVFKGESDQVVYLIRDAHANYSAQKNIARTLKQLDDHAGLEIVFLEGADGAVSWDEAKKISDADTRQRIAEKYLRSADFQGVEYYEMTNDKTAEIWGVENRELYHNALDAFRAVEKNQNLTASEISRISSSVDELKSVYYRPSLQKLDELRKKWLSGSVTFAEYADYLAAAADRAEVNRSRYPLIVNVRSLSKLEEGIDFKVLNQVFSDIATESFRNRLLTDDEEMKALKALSGNDIPVFGKAGNIHLTLAALQKISGGIASGSAAESINRYIEYLQLSEKFDLSELIKEENRLSDEVMQRLAATEYESRILELARVADDLKQLSELKMESGEYEKFKALTRSGLRYFIGRLNELLIESGSESRLIREWKDDLEKWIGTAKRFYELTYLRDDYFTRSMEAKLSSGNYTRSALIAGGFHTENLKHYFRVRGYSYVVITPVVDHETNDSVYKKLLLSQEYQDGHIQVASLQKTSSFGLNYWIRSQIPETAGRIMKEITISAKPNALSASRLANQKKRGNYQGDTSLKKVMEDVRREYADADKRNGTQYVSKIDWSGIDKADDVLVNPNLAFSILYAMKEILNNALDHHVGTGPVGVDFVTGEGSQLSIQISVLNQGDIAWKDLADKAILHAQLNQIYWNDDDAYDLQIGYGRPDAGYSVMDPELVEIMANHETLRKELLFIRGLSAGKRENSIGGAGIGLHFSRKFLREDGADLDFEVIRHDTGYPEVVFHITNISPVNGSRLSVFNRLKDLIRPARKNNEMNLKKQLNDLRESKSAGARLTSEITNEEYAVLKRVTPRRELLDRIVSFMNRLDIQTGDPVVFVGTHTDFSGPIAFAAKGADVRVVDTDESDAISHFEKNALKHAGAMIQQNSGQYIPIRPAAYQNHTFKPDSQKLIYFPKVLDYIPVFNNTIDPGDGRGTLRMPQYMIEKALQEIENGGYLVMSFYSFWDEIVEYAEKAAQHLGIEIRPIEDLPNIDYFEGKKIIGYQVIKKTGARLTGAEKPTEFTLDSGLIEQFFEYGYWVEIKRAKGGRKAIIHHIENDRYRRQFYFRDRVISGDIEYLPNKKTGGSYIDWIFPRMPANGTKLGRAAVEIATVMFLEKNPERGRKIEIDVTKPRVAQSFSEIESFNGAVVDRSVDGLKGFEGEVSDVSEEELRYWNELNRRNQNMAPSEYRQYVINKQMKSFDPHLNFEADGGKITPSEEGSRLAQSGYEDSENLRLSLEMLTDAVEEFKLFLEEYEWPTGIAGSADTAVRQQLVHGVNNFVAPLTWLTELGTYEHLVIEDRIDDLEIASDLALKFSDLLENNQPITSSENFRFPPTYTVSWNLAGAAIKSYQLGEINRSSSAAFISLALQLDLLRSMFEDFKDRFERAIPESEESADEDEVIDDAALPKELTDIQKTLIIKTGIKNPFVFDLPFEYIQQVFHGVDQLKLDYDPDLTQMIREASEDQAVVIRGHRQLFTRDRKDKGEWMLYRMVLDSVIEWISQESGHEFDPKEKFILIESMKNAGIYPDGENLDSIMIIEWHLTSGGIQVNIADQGDVFDPKVRTTPAAIFDPFYFGDPASQGGISGIRPYLNEREQNKDKIGRRLTDTDGQPVGKTLALNFPDKITAARLAGDAQSPKDEVPESFVLNAELIHRFFEYGYFVEWVDAVPEEITAVIYHPETAEMLTLEPNKYFRAGISSNHSSDNVNVYGSVIFFADKRAIGMDMIYPNMPRTGERLDHAAIELVTAMYFRLYAPNKRKFLIHSTNEFMNQTLLDTTSFKTQSRAINSPGEKPAFRVAGAVPHLSDREFTYWNALNERNKSLSRKSYRSAVLSGTLKDPLPDVKPITGSEDEGSRLSDFMDPYGDMQSYTRSFNAENESVDGSLFRALQTVLNDLDRTDSAGQAKVLYIGAGSGVGIFEMQKEFPGRLQVDPVSLHRLSIPEEDFEKTVRADGYTIEDREISNFLKEFNQRMLLNDINLGLADIPDASYDFIYLSKQVMRYIQNKHTVLKEIQRVLKTGGITVVSQAHDDRHSFVVTESATGATYDFFDFINRIVELENIQRLPIQYDPIWTQAAHGYFYRNLRPHQPFPDLTFKEPAEIVKGYRVPDGYAAHYLWNSGSRLSDEDDFESMIQYVWAEVEGYEARGDLSPAMALLVELRTKLLTQADKFKQDIETIDENLRIMRKVINVYQTPKDFSEILNYAVAVNSISAFKIAAQAEQDDLAVYLIEILDTDGSTDYALTSSEINEDGEYRFAFSALLGDFQFPKIVVHPHTRTYIKGKGYYERTLILALTSGIIERVESNTGLSESAENAYKRMMNRSQSDRNYPLQIQKKDGHFIVQLKPGLSPTEYISDGARLSEGSGEAAESMNEWQARLKFYKGRLYEGLYQAFSGTTSGGFGMYVNSAGDMHTAFHVANVDTLILTDQIGLNLAPGNVSLASQQSLLREYSQRPALSEFAVSASERSGLSLRDHLDISLQILGVSPDAIQTLSRIGESNFYKFSFDWRHPDDTHSRRRTVYIAASQPLESLTYTEFPPELTDAIAANNGLDVFIEKAPYFYNEISRDVTRKTLEEGLGDSRGEKEILASNRLKSGLLKAGGLIFSDKEEYGADDAAFPTSGEWLVSETDDFEIIDTPESVNQLSASSEVAEDNGKWGNGRVQILHRIKGKPVSFIDRQGDSGSRLSYDTRPEESGMALPGYIRHDEAVRAAVNPDGAPLKIIYGGSGIDVVHFLKTFDASEGIFVSDFHGLTAADLKDVITLTGFGMQKLKASGDSAIQQYADYKNINGYANRHHVNELYKIKQALAFELLAAGATDIRVVEGRFPTIQFKWSYRPDEPLKIRTIQFAEADITVPAEYPQALKDVIESGFDGFYLRAGMEIASRYGQKKNPFIEYLYNYINQDGVFVTDDVGIIFDTSGGYTRPGAAEYYYDAFPIPVDDIDYVPVPNLIHLAEALLAETPATQALPADFYGWFVRIRRIKSLPEERQIFAAGNIPVKAARLGLVPQLPVLNAGLIQQFFDYGYWIEFESGDKGHTDAYIRHIEGKFDDPDFRDGERHAYLRNNHTYGEIEFIESPYSDSGEPGVELDNIYPRMPRNGLKLGQAAIETAIAFYLEQTDLPERKIHVPLTETRMVNALLEIRSLRAEQREYFGSGEYGIKGEMLPVPQEELEHWKQLNDRNRNMNISEFHRRSESGDMKRFSGARLTDALIYSALHDSARNYTDREWHQIPVGESDYSVRSTGRAKVEIRLNGILQAVNTDVNRVNPTQTSNAFWLSQRQLSTLRSLQSLNTSSKLNPVVLVLDSSPVSDLDPDDVRVDLYYESFARFAFLSGADVRLSQTEADRNSRYLQTAESVFERVRLELISEGREFRGRYLTADMGNPEKAVEAIVRASGISAKKEPGTIHLSIARLSADQPDLIVDFLSGAALIIAAAEHVRFDDDAAETGRIQRESIPAVIVSALADSLGLKGSDRTQKAFWMLEADSRADQIFFGAFPVDRLITQYKFMIRQISIMA